MEFRITV